MKAKITNFIKKIRPEKAFLFLGLIFGLFFLFFTPPMQVPDEWAHYVRILQISDGGFLPVKQGNTIGANLEKSQIDFINNSLTENKGFFQTVENSQKQKSDKQKSFINGTSTYNPIAYTPQLVGVFFVKTLPLNQALIFYTARLFSLMFFLAIAYYSIKIIPFGKWFYLTAALLPMTLSLVASNSVDGMVISMSMFVIAFFLHILAKNNLNKNDIYVIFISTIIISFLKTPVSLIAILYLMLPIKYFKTKKHYVTYLVSQVALISIITLAWSYFVSTYNTGEIIRTMFTGIMADPKEQLSFIIKNPLMYTRIFIKTIWLRGDFYIRSLVGALGFSSIWFNNLIYYSYFGLLFLTLNSDNMSYKWLDKRVRIAALTIFSSMLIIIPTLLYLVYTPVGSSIIDGVYGRYFIPLLFLLPIIAGGLLIRKVEKNNINYNLFIIISNFILLSLCAHHFLSIYYVF